MMLVTVLSEDDNVQTITKLEAIRDNSLLEILVTYSHTLSNEYNTIYFIK